MNCTRAVVDAHADSRNASRGAARDATRTQGAWPVPGAGSAPGPIVSPPANALETAPHVGKASPLGLPRLRHGAVPRPREIAVPHGHMPAGAILADIAGPPRAPAWQARHAATTIPLAHDQFGVRTRRPNGQHPIQGRTSTSRDPGRCPQPASEKAGREQRAASHRQPLQKEKPSHFGRNLQDACVLRGDHCRTRAHDMSWLGGSLTRPGERFPHCALIATVPTETSTAVAVAPNDSGPHLGA